MAEDRWAGFYAVWANALGLPAGDQRVAAAVVRERISLAVQRMEDTAGTRALYAE